MAEERIQKIMAEQGLCSRRAAEQIIAEGRVKVNGHPVKVGDKMDPNRDVLHVDDERIYIQKNQQLYYLALYKPRGYVTTASDELGRKTVMDLVSDIPARLYPVGRLDKDSEGLLLMTNDGAFAQAVTQPSGGCLLYTSRAPLFVIGTLDHKSSTPYFIIHRPGHSRCAPVPDLEAIIR